VTASTDQIDQADQIEGLKLIRLNSAGIHEPDDPNALGFPYKLEVNLSPPELMQVAFIMLHGGSEVMIVRGKTRETIDPFIDRNALRRHPRLRRMTITGPDDLREEISR
jgi:hypothetical protein